MCVKQNKRHVGYNHCRLHGLRSLQSEMTSLRGMVGGQEILALAKLPRHVWRVWEILGKQGLLPPKFVDPPVRTTNLSLFMNAVFVSVIVSFIYSNRVRDSGGNILRRADKLGL